MPYEITIKKITEKTVTKRGEHTVVKEEPWTAEDFSEESRFHHDKEAFLKERPTKKVYGYAPDWRGIEKSETEVLRQTVEELDLTAVIKAVNSIA